MKYVELSFLTPTVKEILFELFGVYDSDLFQTMKSRYIGIFYKDGKIISFHKKGKLKRYPDIPFKIDINEILDYILEENIILNDEERILVSKITN